MSEQALSVEVRARPGRVALGAARAACICVVAAALGIRLWNVLTHTYVIFPDETFQYFEPAHRLAFGAGVVTWEYIDGIRSWLVPGLLAGIMRCAALFSSEPGAYVPAARLVCLALSLTIPYLAFRWGERCHGWLAGLTAGLLCAVWYELVYYAPVILTETLAAHCALWALWLGDARLPTRRMLLATGALLGLAVCIRYQYAPALAAATLWQYRRRGRDLVPIAAAAGAVLLVLAGLLDWMTWGAPFQSIWLNFERNALDGVSAAMGTDSWYFPFEYFLTAWGPVTPFLLILTVIGAVDAPALGIAAAVTLAIHALTPHKEVRFVYLAIAIAPMLIGLGLGRIVARLRSPARYAAAPLALLLAASEARSALAHATPADAWHRDTSLTRPFIAAGAEPGLCGLGVRTVGVYRSGGYTYLHRSVPIYFETAEAVQHLASSPFRLRLRVELDGRAVPQYADEALAQHTQLFNVLIGNPEDGLPGYAMQACFGTGAPGDPTFCVFRRPGGCSQ